MAQFLITTNSKINLPPSRLGTGNIILYNRVNHVFTEYNFINTLPTYQDPDGDAPETLKILSLPDTASLELNSIPCIVGQEIPFSEIVSGNFVLVAEDTDASYYSSFAFDIADVGSSTFSGLGTGLITFNAGPYVNLKPTSVGDNSDTLDYNEVKIFTVADFTTATTPAYADPENDPAESLKVTVLPTQGSLRFNNITVVLNQIILFSDIALGKLTFVANGNQAGYTTNFSFEIADSGSKQFSA